MQANVVGKVSVVTALDFDVRAALSCSNQDLTAEVAALRRVEQEVVELREAAQGERATPERTAGAFSLTHPLSLSPLSLSLSRGCRRALCRWASYRWCMLYLACGGFLWDRVGGEP